MSLALRRVARRVDAHATEMSGLQSRRVDLEERRQHLVRQINLLREQAVAAGEVDAPRIQAECIDAGKAAARPYLDALAPALGSAGLARAAAGERPGGRTLGGSVGEVEVRCSELPGQGDYVLLDASGPCVDVPEGDRDEWEGRPDPAPIVE